MESTTIVNTLENLGFRLEALENNAYSFTFEGLNIIYDIDTDDSHFLRLIAPGIYELGDDGSRIDALEAVNLCNSHIKYAKTSLINENVWAFVEQYVSDDIRDIEDMLRTSILVLRTIVTHFHECLEEIVSQNEQQ